MSRLVGLPVEPTERESPGDTKMRNTRWKKYQSTGRCFLFRLKYFIISVHRTILCLSDSAANSLAVATAMGTNTKNLKK